MSRPIRIHDTAAVVSFQPLSTKCLTCGHTAWVAYHTQRRITTLQGRFCLSLTIRQCHQEACPRYHHPYRPEEEGRWALPYGEYGLDVIALVGMLRYVITTVWLNCIRHYVTGGSPLENGPYLICWRTL